MDQQILRGVAATLRWTNTDSDGIATPAAGTVTASAVRASGAAVTLGAVTDA